MTNRPTPFYVDGKLFNSKIALKRYVRSLIDSPVFAGSPSFWEALIKRHPDADFKIGSGISKVFRTKSFRDYTLKIERVDGSVIDFSWVRCVNSRPAKSQSNLLQAMRACVDDQVNEFKLNSTNACAACSISHDEMHVDHVVSFSDIAKQFLLHVISLPNEFDDCPRTFRPVFKKEHAALAHSWQNFHKERAVLQLLCVPCHVDKTKKDSRNVNV